MLFVSLLSFLYGCIITAAFANGLTVYCNRLVAEATKCMEEATRRMDEASAIQAMANEALELAVTVREGKIV